MSAPNVRLMSTFAAAQASTPSVPAADDNPITPTEIAAIRARFSSLTDEFVYLDAPGGTQTPDEVGAATARVYLEASGNTGAPYATSQVRGEFAEHARAAPPKSGGCPPEEIIFGGNMPSLNFMPTRT